MRNILVSVIIPAHNAMAWLEECLDSLAAQTFQDFEVIVVDDGSTDTTVPFVTDYQILDDRFRIVSQPQGGVSKARNTGIDHALGRYVTFVDADDALHPEALAAMYNAIKETGAPVCITGFTSWKGDLAGRGIKVYGSRKQREIYSYRKAMKAALYQKRIMNAPWGVMMERSLLTPDRRFREGIRYEDLDAFYRFYEGVDKIVYLPYTYYFYRDNPEGFINRWSDSRLDVLDVTDRLEKFFKDRYPELKKAAADRRYSAHFNMLVLMLKNGVDNPAALERCRKVIKEGRWRALTDPNVRMKNKVGALASFLGEGFIKRLL